MPEEGDVFWFGLVLKRGEGLACFDGGVVDDVLPGGNIDVAAGALGYFVPVHVFASFVDHPHQLAEGGVVLDHDVKRERSRGGDDRVGGGTAEHVDDGGVGLVEGEDDSVQVVEGTGKKGNDQLDRVGQVDGHAVATLVD